MSIRDEIDQIFQPYKREPEYNIAMTKFRGLMRTYQNLEDRVKGKPAKRRKRRANPSTDTPDA